LLKEIAPHVTRVGVLRDPTRGPGIGQFAVIQKWRRRTPWNLPRSMRSIRRLSTAIQIAV
jgi:hypothetical protein